MDLEFLDNYEVPKKNGEYILRKWIINSKFCHYLYSKSAKFLMPIMLDTTIVSNDELNKIHGEYNSDVDFEFYGSQKHVENKIKEYFYLSRFISRQNKKHSGLYGYLGYNSVSVLQHNVNPQIISFKKSYSLTGHLVEETNSISYSVVAPDFEVDCVNILRQLIDISNEELGMQFQTKDIDTRTIERRKLIQVYNLSCPEDKMAEIRKGYKQHGWTIIHFNKERIEKAIEDNLKLIETIILCEGNNKKLFDILNLENYWFSDQLNSLSLYDKVKTREIHVLRDKDFLTKEEVKKFRRKFRKFHILEYYCIENYLYHPDNVAEVLAPSFNRQAYIEYILNEKNNTPLAIDKIQKSRKTYNEFKDNNFKEESGADELIFKTYNSDDFNVFYEFFSMKDINKSYIHELGLRQGKLVQTKWFKEKLLNILRRTIP